MSDRYLRSNTDKRYLLRSSLPYSPTSGTFVPGRVVVVTRERVGYPWVNTEGGRKSPVSDWCRDNLLDELYYSEVSNPEIEQ